MEQGVKGVGDRDDRCVIEFLSLISETTGASNRR